MKPNLHILITLPILQYSIYPNRTKSVFFQRFFLLLTTSIFKVKKMQKSRFFLFFFACWWKDSDPGSTGTYGSKGSGSGSLQPTYIYLNNIKYLFIWYGNPTNSHCYRRIPISSICQTQRK